MSRAAPLLRALLCLVLLLNGTGYAHAATRMAMGTLATAGAATVESASHQPSCHEAAATDHAAIGHVAMDHVVAIGADAASPHDGDHAMPDCCHSGSCDGPCTQHAPAMAWPAPVATVLPRHAAAPAYRAITHASAVLTHHHRPPIVLA